MHFPTKAIVSTALMICGVSSQLRLAAHAGEQDQKKPGAPSGAPKPSGTKPAGSAGKQAIPGSVISTGQEGYGKVVKTVPQDFPIPLLTGGKLVSAEDVVARTGKSYYVRWRVPNDLSSTVSWYVESLKAQQWKVPSNPTADARGRVRMLVSRSDAAATFLFSSVNEADGKTDIVITVSTR